MRSLKYNLLALVLLVASSFVLHAQSYNMDDIDGTTVNVLTATTVSFFDSGGNGGNYSNNENYIATFRSVNGAPLLFTFTAFQTYNASDYLEIYDGTSTAAPLIGRYSGTTSPGTFTPSGEYITFRFVSDNTTFLWQPTVRAGWAATITSMDISAAEIATCSGTFTDKGGGGYYAVNQYYAQTYRSIAGKSLRFDFTSFSLDNDREDRLLVYDGADLTAPLIGDYRFNDKPGTVISSNDALTFVFISNNDGSTAAGWSADIKCFNIQTFYSYQSGDWDNPACWTTDPSSSTRVNLGDTFPKALDKAVIKNGHTIKLPKGGFSVTQLDIQQGAILDVQGTNNHNFGTIMGKGRLRSTTGDLPEGVYTLFTQAGAGTIELYDQITTSPTLDKTTFNNLEINANSSRTVNIGSTTQINGNLLVKGGVLNINSPAGSSVTVQGNITVSSGAVFGMGNTSTNQRELIVKGNFENEGTVTFSSNATANYTADPASGVTLVFNNPAQNQSFVVNGVTTLDRLIVDKGTDDTYMLDVNASNTTNFRLNGRNNSDYNFPAEPPTLDNRKALDIYAGTLRLGSNISIPRLLTTSGTTNQYAFVIDQDAALILDGANVAVTDQTNNSTIIVYGKLKVAGNSTFTALGRQGIILREYGVVDIEGTPTINITAFRTSSRTVDGAHRGTLIMKGGTMTITGNSLATSHPSLALPFPDNTLQLSGGTINILSPSYYGGTNSNESWLVSSNPENISITGGTVNVYANGTNARVNSTAPFFNLNLLSNSGNTISIEPITEQQQDETVTVPAAPRRPLVVLNNLTIAANTTFNPQNENVTVGRNFTITGTYTPGTNTTTFNAFGIQAFNNNGTITGPGLYDMVLSNGSILTISNQLSVRNNLAINTQTTLRDGGQTISVAGNITNSGKHESAIGGSIVLNGTVDQFIYGDGLGVFGNLSLGKSSGITQLAANFTITGNLRLGGSAALLKLGANRLSLGATSNIYNALTGTNSLYTGFNSTRMIETAGAQSDLGLSKDWAATGTFTYPVGISGKYTPAIIDIDSPPALWGSLSVNPVNNTHPLSTSTNLLEYYWNLRRSEMTEIPSGNLRIRFYYEQGDVVGDEDQYIPAYYYPSSWTVFNDPNLITKISNEIRFLDVPDPRGHFTAGEPACFGEVKAYYSNVTNGNWETISSWSYDAAGTLPAGELPGQYSPVVIQSGHKINTTENGHKVGSLTIEENGVLDVNTTTGHFFGLVHESTVSGTGTLRISSNTTTAEFPGGDFGEFLGEAGGTVEYYTMGTNFTMPAKGKQALTILDESFNAGGFPPTGWIRYNSDGGGNQWVRSTARSRTGVASAAHMRRNSNENGMLVTPALNLSEEAVYELNFYRYTTNSASYNYFGIWVSTTDNNQGSFSEYMVLGQGSSAWQQHSIDLSEFVGNGSVYIAFVYQGRNADDVYIDDVTVTKSLGTSRYHNLIINPEGSRTITLPSIDVATSGKVIVKGAGVVATSSGLAATLTVSDSTIITDNGTLRLDNTRVFKMEQKGALTIGTNASFLVNTAGTAKAHALNLYGNVENNGTINLNPGSGKYADITFKGTTNQVFSGTGATSLNRVYVDKGTNQTPLINVTADQFTMNTSSGQALFINNGTIRFSGASLNLTLTTNTTFSIPATGCLSVNGSTVTMGSAANNGADLLLVGKLEVMAGTMNIGAAANNTHNDIEYATAGAPEVSISGGTLNVNGQIRRSTTIATGNLTYRQTGGNVYIHGKNRDGDQIKRGLLEVLNSGSYITSGGNLYLVQGVVSGETRNGTFGELYLEPASSTVTGGTIITGTAATGATTNYFNLYLGCPIYNLTVDGTTNAKEARLKTFEAEFMGGILIDGPASSTFNANKINFSIAGDFISKSGNRFGSFIRGVDTQRTTFNGVNQHVYKDDTYAATGGLTFGEVVVDLRSNGTLTLEKFEFWARGDLYLVNGNLVQNSSSHLLVMKNLYISNGFSHISNASGRLTFYNSTQSQYIYSDGTGSLGRIIVYYNNGVFLDGDLRINNRLDFPTTGGVGSFNIGNSKLTLGSSAIIGTGSNAPGAGRFIITNGALSDGGVTKEFTSAGGSFTFPIGVGSAGGKYTPATLNVTNTGGVAGSITVKPVDAPHPVCTNDITDELQYFWNVTSTGFSNPTVSHSYTYMDGDIQGNENNYVNARYHNFTWTNSTEILDFAGNRILFTGVNYIDGEYTAGIISNFGTVYKYYSKTSGNWNIAGSWDIETSPGVFVAAPAPPRGNPVFIQTGHTITTNQNGAYAGSVDIDSGARLSFDSTTEHNLGHVSGSGTMAFTATSGGSFVFPGGDYSDFMNTTGSTVEYSGAGTLPSGITTYQNVTFLGNNTKKIPAIDILIKGNLRIGSGALSNADFNRTIRIEGDWYNAVAGGFVPGSGLVVFAGGNEQQLTSLGAGGEQFYNLTIDKTAGSTLTLNSNATVNRFLTLTSGLVNTTSTNLLTVSYGSTVAVVGGSATAYVNGPLRRMVNNSSNATFPVGKDGRYGSLYIFGTTSTGSQYYTAEYFNTTPTDNLNFAAPLQLISNNEYWRVTGVAGASANLGLRWDNLSAIIPASALDRQKLRVAQYLSRWTKVGETVNDVSQTQGTVETSTPIAFGGVAQDFTLALEQTASAQITSSKLAGCNDGSLFPVTFNVSGDAPLSVVIQVNGVNNRTLTNLSEGNHTINFTYAELFAISGAGDYTITISSVKDVNNLSGIVLGSGVVLTLYTTPNPIISGPTAVMTGSSTNFSITAVSGNTYSWSVSALGSIVGSSTGSTIQVKWAEETGIATITVTQSNTNCSTVATYDVNVRDWPVITGNFNVCANATEVYASKEVAGHVYNWSVVGGTITAGAGTYQISVQWSTQTAGRVTLSQGPTNDLTTVLQDVVINTSPTAVLTIDGSSSICDEETVVLQFGNAQGGVSPTYYLLLDGVEYSPYETHLDPKPNPFTTEPLIWSGATPDKDYVFSLRVTNTTTGCTSAYVTKTVKVWKIPETGPPYHIPNTFGD